MTHFVHVVFYQKLATCVIALLYLCIPKHYIYTNQTSEKPLFHFFYVKLKHFFKIKYKIKNIRNRVTKYNSLKHSHHCKMLKFLI